MMCRASLVLCLAASEVEGLDVASTSEMPVTASRGDSRSDSPVHSSSTSGLPGYECYLPLNCYGDHGAVELDHEDINRGASASACAEACNGEDQCAGFVYMGSQRKCWRRSQIWLSRCERGSWDQVSSQYLTCVRQAPCKLPAESCQSDGDCCDKTECKQLLGGKGKVCAPPPCASQGQPCQSDGDCCDKDVCQQLLGGKGKVCAPAHSPSSSLHIKTPQEMVDALQHISGGESYEKQRLCDAKDVVVADGLFGSVGLEGPNLDGRGVDFKHSNPLKIAQAMVFWSPGSSFPQLLEACCGVQGGGNCACEITKAVGIETKDRTFVDQRFLVVEGVVSNESATPRKGEEAKKPINTLSPTWANFAKVTPSVFDDVFTKSGIDWMQKCSSGKISESAVSTLGEFTLGCGDSCKEGYTGTEGTIVQFIEKFPSMTSLFNISCMVADDCSSCTDQNVNGQPNAQTFFDAVPGPDGLCSDAATLRAFMFYYYDANVYFCGSGRDPSGPEFVTLPNLRISEAGGSSAEVQFFEGSFTCSN